MRSGHSRLVKRSGFTLIELLVVIAIIGVLIGLTASAVMRFMLKGPEVKTRTEIGQFDGALAAVQTELNGVGWVPSLLILREDGNYNGPQYAQTVAFLTQAFGKYVTTPGVQIDWNGDGAICSVPNKPGYYPPPTDARFQFQNGDLVLYGEQTLVFLLGGIPTAQSANGPYACVGFANGNNPAVAGGTRRGPWFPFETTRLVPHPNNKNGFPVYLDPWMTGPARQPYVFFSHYKALNGYMPNDSMLIPGGPYFTKVGSVNNFVNSQGWQIISAGKNQLFGPGGTTWDPAKGTTNPAGVDDQVNFSRSVLGAPQG